MSKRTFDKELLYELYITKDMTISEMTKSLKTGNHTLGRELKKHNLVQIKRDLNRTIKDKRVYKIWQGMKTRCYNINDSGYKHYGGRGIEMCKEWRESFQSFYNWSMNNGYKSNLTIDRVDFNGNYEPINCRWAGYDTQNNNKRDNIVIKYKGKDYSVEDISNMTGVNSSTIRSRLASGWSFEKIVETPKLEYGGDTVSNPTNSRKVRQLTLLGDTIQEFESIKEASKKTGSNYYSISKALRGELKRTNGFKWEYV